MFGSSSTAQRPKASLPPQKPQAQASIQRTLRANPPSRGLLTATPPTSSGSVLSSFSSNRTISSPSQAPPRPNPYQVPKGKGALLRAFDNSSAFRENEPMPFESGGQSPPGVFFDEGDFEDDGDLDFNDSMADFASSTITSFAVPAVPANRNPSTSRQRPGAEGAELQHSGFPSSSAPFDWSSSPAEHFLRPPGPSLVRQPATIGEDAGEEDAMEEIPRSKKRQVHPWENKDGSDENPLPTRKSTTSRVERKRLTSAYPWDMTASDLKRRKSEQKRSYSTAPSAQPTLAPKAMKQKPLTLSPEQNHVLDIVRNAKKSVFFTGSAGTGKSVLLREVIRELRGKGPQKETVAITASTGLAACNIGGVTLHSFAGIGLGKGPAEELVKKIKRNPKAKNRWIRTKVLVIDEISMVDAELFDKLEKIARILKNNGRPFGGIQLVITGDFFQLPPVPDSGRIAKFAFEADSWNTTIEHTIGLTQVFRQRDPEFAEILNEMRLGSLSDSSVSFFERLSRPLHYDDGLEATELFPTRGEVDTANFSKMRQITGKSVSFVAEDSGTITEKTFRDKLLASCMAPAKIELKVNSQVMLIKNIDETLVNGSLGRVIGFMSEKTFDYLQDDPEALEAASVEAVAPSDQKKIRDLARGGALPGSTGRVWPLVQFALPDGTTRQLLTQPEQWKVELPNGEVQAQRSQIPLILAWALSIHKAQGQTLERVKVDLGKVFEKGQAYVALSRATCKEGLQVLRFDKRKVMAHDKVAGFYRRLSSASQAKTSLDLSNSKTLSLQKRQRVMPEEDSHEEGSSVMSAEG